MLPKATHFSPSFVSGRAQWADTPLARSPIHLELAERADYNWDIWAIPDERMERQFWYFRINQRRRTRPRVKMWNDVWLTEVKARPTHDRWFKHYTGTEEFNEAIAKGERPNPLFKMGRLHGVLTPREVEDQRMRLKITYWRHFHAFSYVNRQHVIDSYGRPETKDFLYMPRGSKWKKRFSKLRKLRPSWWLPRLSGSISYALFKGRMPFHMWADRYRKFHINQDRLEFRKWRRHDKRQWSTDVTVSVRARMLFGGLPEKLRPILGPAIHRFHHTFIDPLYTPAYGRWLTALFVKVPLVGFLGYSFYQALQTTSNVVDDSPSDTFQRIGKAVFELNDAERYTEEHMKDYLEVRYPRKL